MSDLLNIGASAIRGYSRALQTVGDNIANANTAGYVRRDVRLAEPPPLGDAVLYRNQVSPGGVTVQGVRRSTDAWLVADARVAGGEAGQAASKLNWLEAAERALADGGAGVGKALTTVFNRADELAADAGSGAARQGFLQAVDDLAATFRRTGAGLADAAEGIATQAKLSVDTLNTDVAALQRINDGLRRAREGSTNQAGLLDERDRLLDAIATALPVGISFEATGAANLTLGDGTTLLSGSVRQPLAVAAAGDGRLRFDPAMPSGGSLGGLAAAADHVAAQRGQLDALAGDVANRLNAQHAAGRTPAGAAGSPLFDGTSATDLRARALTPGDVAAGNAASDNGNALAFNGLRGSDGGEAAWAALVAAQSRSVASGRAHDAAASSRRSGADAARSDLSAVDLDHEAGDMLRFQQAYDASARVLQVARETMQSILNAL